MHYILTVGRGPTASTIRLPWLWLATLVGDLVAMGRPYCALIDARTGAVLTDWGVVTLEGPGAAAVERIIVQPNGTTHTHYAGTTAYGKGQTPKGGHKPVTIIDQPDQQDKTSGDEGRP